MAEYTVDFNARGKRKAGGRVDFTYEILEELLHLPKGTRIMAVNDDFKRDIVSFKFCYENDSHGGYEVSEGAEYPSVSISMEEFGLRTLKKAEEIKQAAEQGREWAQVALQIFKEED